MGVKNDGAVKMAPSILSADFLNLQSTVGLVADSADFIHVDVMDGHFVPNLTIGPAFVKRLKESFTVPLDVHLMVEEPDKSVDWYIDAGADIVTMHIEALTHAHRAIQHVHDRGARVGIALNPATPIWAVRELVSDVDLVLLMSVNPGFGGQSFIQSTLRKLDELVKMCEEFGAAPLIEVDGGISRTTAPLACAAGARVLVAGSAVFGAPDPCAAMEDIRRAGQSALG